MTKIYINHPESFPELHGSRTFRIFGYKRWNKGGGKAKSSLELLRDQCFPALVHREVNHSFFFAVGESSVTAKACRHPAGGPALSACRHPAHGHVHEHSFFVLLQFFPLVCQICYIQLTQAISLNHFNRDYWGQASKCLRAEGPEPEGGTGPMWSK